MRVAYADPPYIGQARRHYKSEEVDHKELIDMMLRDFDAWALSASSSSLNVLLPLCPAYTWEPVLFYSSRAKELDTTIKDHIIVSATMKKGLAGAKPIEFCHWLFKLLGMKPGDEFVDLFPGTGVVTRCWEDWGSMSALHRSIE